MKQDEADRLNYIFGGVKESKGYLKHNRDWLCCYCDHHAKTENEIAIHVKKWHDEDWKKSYGFHAESEMSEGAQEFYRELHRIQTVCVMDGRRTDADRIETFKMSRGIPFGHPIGIDIPQWIRELEKQGAPKSKPKEYVGWDSYIIGRL